MTKAEKSKVVKQLVGELPEATDNGLIELYLADAKHSILNRMYPFGYKEETEVPYQYELLQCKLASRYILRRGAEGEKQHNENGINRTYESVNDEDILQEVMQVIGAGVSNA